MKSAAEQLEEIALREAFKFSCMTGLACVEIAYMFAEKSGDYTWFQPWKLALLKSAAKACKVLALRELSEQSWEDGDLCIELAYMLGERSGDVDWFQTWKQVLLKSAAEKSKEAALRLYSTKFYQAKPGFELSYKFAKNLGDNIWFQNWANALPKIRPRIPSDETETTASFVARQFSTIPPFKLA